MEKYIKEKKDKKATGDDDVPENVLKVLGEDGLSIVIQVISNIYETGESSKDFTESMTIASHKKPKATKCSDHGAISLIAHIGKIVASKHRRRIERKI